MSDRDPKRGLDVWLLVALALGAALRLTGLGWGARHRPLGDEQSFVEAVAHMIANRSLDHQFYEYPGLFLYLLVPGQWLAGGGDGFAATVAGRTTVALFGVVSIALVYALARTLAGTGVARLAALLKAASPLDVEQAHMIRTDVVLEVAFLLGLLALARPLRPHRRDAAAGAALGVASAIKFSGPLFAAPVAVAALLRRRGRLAGLARSAAWAALVFTLCSPYTFLNAEKALGGAGIQMRYHYEGRSEAPGYFENLGAYGVRLGESLGLPWLLLAAGGAWTARRRWRRFAPLVVLPAAVLLVFATAEVRYDRFLVPTTGALAVLAAAGAARLARTRARSMVALGALALAWPTANAVLDVRSYRQPSPRDLAQEMLATWSGPGQRVLTTSRELGAPAGVAMTRARNLDPWTRRLALEYDVVVAVASHVGEPLRHMDVVRHLRPTRATAGQGPELVVLVPKVPPAQAYEWSEAPYHLVETPQPAVVIGLPETTVVDALEWEPAAAARRAPRLRLLASSDGERFAAVEFTTERSPAGPGLRILPLEPVTAVALRLETVAGSPLDPPARLRRARLLTPP